MCWLQSIWALLPRMLAIYFEVDGEQKHLTIGQGLNYGIIQKMTNETEDIMNINAPGNERNRPL